MKDERTLMDVLRNEATYPRLSDWEKAIIRRTQYKLDIAQAELEIVNTKLKEIEGRLKESVREQELDKMFPLYLGDPF